MKYITPVLAATALLAASPTTFAGGGHGYGHLSYGHSSGHYRGHNGYYGRSYRRSHRHRSHRGEYLVGGILLGSLIANSVHRAHSYPPHVERRVDQPSRTVYTERSSETVTRRLLRDVNGDCFELYTARDGSEVRESIAREECSW